ncbi:MAG: hypothetical protein QXZ43_00075 [Candidatus Aenigmatarchaeota archaeon]
MNTSKKGQTDYINLFFLGTLLVLTIIVIFLTVPGLSEFLKDFFSYIFSSIIVIAIGSFLILFGVIIAGTNVGLGKTLAYIGVMVLLLGFFIIEMAYVSKSKESLKIPMTERCSGSGKIFIDANPADFITCIITGYRYGGDYGTWSFLGFWLFGVIIPLLLFISLFYDFVDASGVIKQPNSKKIVGCSLGLIAYRGFIVTNLLEILSLGTVGIALIALNLIFLGGLLAYIHRVFEKWRPIEHAMGLVRAEVDAKKILKNLTRSAIQAANQNNQESLLEIIKSMRYFATSLEEQEIIARARNYAMQGNYNEAGNQLQNLLNRLNE